MHACNYQYKFMYKMTSFCENHKRNFISYLFQLFWMTAYRNLAVCCHAISKFKHFQLHAVQ